MRDFGKESSLFLVNRTVSKKQLGDLPAWIRQTANVAAAANVPNFPDANGLGSVYTLGR